MQPADSVEPFPAEVIDALATYLATHVGHSVECYIIDVMAHPHALRILRCLTSYREAHRDVQRFREELLA